jgi:hypothetical protein
MSLNGFGQRSKLFMDLYVQALYVTNYQDGTNFDSQTEMAIS